MDSLGLPADMMVIVLNMLSHDINKMFSLNNTFVIFMLFKESLYPKSQTTKRQNSRRTTLFHEASRNWC